MKEGINIVIKAEKYDYSKICNVIRNWIKGNSIFEKEEVFESYTGATVGFINAHSKFTTKYRYQELNVYFIDYHYYDMDKNGCGDIPFYIYGDDSYRDITLLLNKIKRSFDFRHWLRNSNTDISIKKHFDDDLKYCYKRFLNSFYGTQFFSQEDNMRIVNVIFNGPATIVFWNDGSKTIVKKEETDSPDIEKALLYAYLKHILCTEDYHKVIETVSSFASVQEAIKDKEKIE